jgi:YVTN family beta-propeller protein
MATLTWLGHASFRLDTDDGKRIYAANGGAGSVSVIDVATNKVTGEIAVGKRPWNMALTPDGKKLYVANGRSNSVSVIDTAALKVVKEIPVGELPWGVVIPQ